MISTKKKGKVIGLILVAVCVLSFLSPIQVLSQTPAKKININTASLDELQTLPRIGEKVAQRIIDYREQHGDFEKIEELMKVQGIGEKIFKLIRDKIEVGSKAK